MFCMYFLMTILNMAKFRRQRELGKQMFGWVVPAWLSHVLRMKVVRINRWRTIVLGKQLKVKMLLV